MKELKVFSPKGKAGKKKKETKKANYRYWRDRKIGGVSAAWKVLYLQTICDKVTEKRKRWAVNKHSDPQGNRGLK